MAQDELRAARRIVQLYLDDHDRMPRDAWPKRPGNPRDYVCRCKICQEAIKLFRDEEIDEEYDPDYDPVQRQEIDLADESHRADLMGFNDDPPDPPEPGDYYDR